MKLETPEELAEYDRWLNAGDYNGIDGQELVRSIKRRVSERARIRELRGTRESWRSIRKRIWLRDRGICQVCESDMNGHPEYYECGHIIDQAAGGKDHDDNLVVMCISCNRRKPLHETREEYDHWIADGGMSDELLDRLRAIDLGQDTE